MKFNTVGQSREFETKDRKPLYILTIIVAAIFGFVMLIVSNLFIVLLILMLKFWYYVAIGVVIFIFLKLRARRKRKNENRT